LNPYEKEQMTLETIDIRILDELADGQWHPLYKIRKNITTDGGDVPAFKPTKEVILERLSILVEDGTLREGNNDSYRFNSDHLLNWREQSDTLDKNNKQYQPRYFGGILEDDGWELAGLKTYDLIHFRVTGDLTKALIVSLTQEKPSQVQVDEDNLYRVFTNNGKAVYDLINEAKREQPSWGISGIRLEKDLRRRDIDDLPRRFVSDLCRYYGEFAKVLLRSNMSSILKHLPEADDIQQQIYIWIMDAVQRYDATTSIPFGAYLGTALKKWVFNLNRKAFGRSAADTELKYSRASAEFKATHGKDPSAEELAQFMDLSIEAVKKDSMMINTVSNLRNVGAIYHDDAELPIPAEGEVEDNIEALVNATLLSATITTAAKRAKVPDGAIGLAGVFYENWGSEHKTKKVSAWLKTDRTQHAVSFILKNAQQMLRQEELLG
jgi:hypothetical protein